MRIDFPTKPCGNMTAKQKMEYVWKELPCISPIRVLGIWPHSNEFTFNRLMQPRTKGQVSSKGTLLCDIL